LTRDFRGTIGQQLDIASKNHLHRAIHTTIALWQFNTRFLSYHSYGSTPCCTLGVVERQEIRYASHHKLLAEGGFA
jgi:hypothetical protein